MKFRSLVALAAFAIPTVADAAPPADEAALVAQTAALQQQADAAGMNPLAVAPLVPGYKDAVQAAAQHPATDWEGSLGQIAINPNGSVLVLIGISTSTDPAKPRSLTLGTYSVSVGANSPVGKTLATMKPGDRVRFSGQVLGTTLTTFNSFFFTALDFRLDRIEPAA